MSYYFHVIALPFKALIPTVHKFTESITLKYFLFDRKTFLHRFLHFIMIIPDVFLSVMVRLLSRIR